jgi:alpha-L-glutamate ligase-like protein
MTSIGKILKNRKKVLGLNERYLTYIRPNNLRKAIKIADDKVLTKQVLQKYDIPTPEMLGLIRDNRELQDFDFDSLPSSFVIKPAKGVRGGGVEVIYNKDKEGKWIKGDGSRITAEDIKSHCRDILDGRYSLFYIPDFVLIEERVRPHKAFKYYTYKGTPDVRVIVYNNIPVMSFIRLPTKESEGRANLDQGAIGAGIDMAVGKTTHAIIGKSTDIEYIPEYKLPLSGLRIPFWDRILKYSIEASQATKLGYAAIDFLIDKEKGPMIVELNARPGLSIQLSNEDGLRRRLKKASGIKVKTAEKGARLAKDLFGGEIEEEIETISGKDVIGIYETITLYGKNKTEHMTKAKIDTGADSTSIDREIALKLGYENIIEAFDLETQNLPANLTHEEEVQLMNELAEKLKPKYEDLVDVNLIHSSHGSSLRPYVKVDITIGDTRFETNATIYDRSKLTYPVIVGRKSLGKFLVDPSKK